MAGCSHEGSGIAPDVDVPATGGLVVPRTNTLPPPRFFAPTNQVAGRWHGNACGGLPPRLALLRSLSYSLAASQANAPAIAEKTFCIHAWVAMHTVRVPSSPPCCSCRPWGTNLPPILPMVPMQLLPVHKSLQIRQTQSLRRRSSRARTRFAGCVH